MASFPQPAVDPATDPARPHISKEALPHIIDFLRDEKPSVRHRAVLGLLAQSQLPDGPALLLTIWSTDKKKRVVGELCRLVGDLHDIAPDVLSTLINLSGTDMGLDQMLASPRLTDALSKEKYYFCENKNKLNSSGYFRNSPYCMTFFFLTRATFSLSLSLSLSLSFFLYFSQWKISRQKMSIIKNLV